MQARKFSGPEAGFSLLELMIAMVVTLVVMVAASTLLMSTLNIRTREDTRSNALADAQQALNMMSREIALSGFGLTMNGIVVADSSNASIRVRANLNALLKQATSNVVTEQDEDVMYALSANPGNQGNALIRSDINTNQARVLASRINTLDIRYLSASGVEVAAANAERVRLALSVTLPQVGAPGSSGYQPASSVQLASDVVLRNMNLAAY